MLGFGSKDIPTAKDNDAYGKANSLLQGQRLSSVITLASGEQMSYGEVGDREGLPCVWFGGPCSNRFIIALYDEICLELGIRLICFDRPGRGASTPLRNPKDWSFESIAGNSRLIKGYVDEATDILQIPKFYAIGHSFGCSYLLASYNKLSSKIIGGLRLLAAWAPSNLPCMPKTYAIQRSLPTKFVRALTSFGQSPNFTSLTYQQVPCQMGSIGYREGNVIHNRFHKEILERVGSDHLSESFKAYEHDWLLALEIQKPFPYSHRQLKCSIKCWHGMEDSITPLGAAMWMQREMDHFLLFAVEGASHNIHLDMAIVKAVFADVIAENLTNSIKSMKESEETLN